MNHHEAQVIADSYRGRASELVGGDDRWWLLMDQAAVWQRVADALKPAITARIKGRLRFSYGGSAEAWKDEGTGLYYGDESASVPYMVGSTDLFEPEPPHVP